MNYAHWLIRLPSQTLEVHEAGHVETLDILRSGILVGRVQAGQVLIPPAPRLCDGR